MTSAYISLRFFDYSRTGNSWAYITQLEALRTDTVIKVIKRRSSRYRAVHNNQLACDVITAVCALLTNRITIAVAD